MLAVSSGWMFGVLQFFDIFTKKFFSLTFSNISETPNSKMMEGAAYSDENRGQKEISRRRSTLAYMSQNAWFLQPLAPMMEFARPYTMRLNGELALSDPWRIMHI